MFRRFVVVALVAGLLAVSLPGQSFAQNHGVTVTWPASASAAGCVSTTTPACTNPGYQIYEGPGPGQESATPLNSTLITGLVFTDDGPTMNAYLGTTRCYKVAFQDTIGTVTTQTLTGEACVTFPLAPAAPTTIVLTSH